MKMLRFTNARGFSLVELMVVVAIISILSAIAIPKFRTFQAKARQAEAKMNLENIYSLEASYQAENDIFIDLAKVCNMAAGGGTSSANTLGFYITDCGKARYEYDVSNATTVVFDGRAISGAGTNNKIVPGCATADEWHINENKIISATYNAVAGCP